MWYFNPYCWMHLAISYLILFYPLLVDPYLLTNEHRTHDKNSQCRLELKVKEILKTIAWIYHSITKCFYKNTVWHLLATSGLILFSSAIFSMVHSSGFDWCLLMKSMAWSSDTLPGRTWLVSLYPNSKISDGRCLGNGFVDSIFLVCKKQIINEKRSVWEYIGTLTKYKKEMAITKPCDVT